MRFYLIFFTKFYKWENDEAFFYARLHNVHLLYKKNLNAH